MRDLPRPDRSLRCLALAAALCLGAPSGALALALADLGGHYEGGWLNQTFGSTGAASIDITIAGSDVSVVFDMDGFVFGQIDPPAIAMAGTIAGDVMSFASTGLGLFGDVAGSIQGSDGSLVFLLDTIPGEFISKVDVEGSIAPDELGNLVIAVAYLVEFPGPPGPFNPAAGVLAVTRETVIPEPGTATLLALGLGVLARARYRISRFRIFPVGPFGSASRNSTTRGYL